MNLSIRLATIEEAPLVHKVMQAAFAEYIGVLNPPSGANRETVVDVEEGMRLGGAALAWDGQTAVGSARFRYEVDYVYVGRVAVIPECRGKGVGLALMRFIEGVIVGQALLSIRVVVRMQLPQNITFYEKLGYKVIEIGPHPKAGDQVATLEKLIGDNQ